MVKMLVNISQKG